MSGTSKTATGEAHCQQSPRLSDRIEDVTSARIPFVLSAPSGAGKTTLALRLLERVDRLTRTISCTTRAPRHDERDAIDYFFIDRAEFERRRDDGAFLEWAEVHGNLYATPRSELDRIHTLGGAANGHDALLVIDVQGAANLRREMSEAVTVFVLPPSSGALRDWLVGRDASDKATSVTIGRRLRVAVDEISQFVHYDYIVVNEDIELATEELASIVRAERSRRARRVGLAQSILRSFEAAPGSGDRPYDAGVAEHAKGMGTRESG